MKKIVLASAIALAATGQAYADYQFEVGGVYTDGEISSVDYDGLGVAGEFHFDKVDTSKGPLAEASFLDKSSFVNFSFISIEPDVANADDVDTTNIGGRFVTANNIIIEADWATVDTGNDDDDTIRVGVGTYLNDNTDVVVSYSTDDDTDVLDATFHGLNSLSQGASVGYDVTVAYIDTDDDSGYQIGVGGTYYFNNMFGLGLNASVQDVGDYSSDRIGISASFFPNEQVELLATIFDDGGDADGNGLLIGGAVRF